MTETPDPAAAPAYQQRRQRSNTFDIISIGLALVWFVISIIIGVSLIAFSKQDWALETDVGDMESKPMEYKAGFDENLEQEIESAHATRWRVLTVGSSFIVMGIGVTNLTISLQKAAERRRQVVYVPAT